jgi:hypothetical protein
MADKTLQAFKLYFTLFFGYDVYQFSCDDSTFCMEVLYYRNEKLMLVTSCVINNIRETLWARLNFFTGPICPAGCSLFTPKAMMSLQ